MSSESSAAPPDRSACSPCRGTGRVVSNLGGAPSEVACPWCGGTGRFDPGHDAQDAEGDRAAERS